MADWVACRDFPDLVFGVQEHTGPVAAQGPGLHPSAGPAGYAAFAPRTSGLAVASLVLGILFLCGIGSLLATIFGAVALGQISRSRGALTGKGMAVAGLVLGIIGLGFIAVLILTSSMDGTADRIRMRF
jgi:hypothetical protein